MEEEVRHLKAEVVVVLPRVWVATKMGVMVAAVECCLLVGGEVGSELLLSWVAAEEALKVCLAQVVEEALALDLEVAEVGQMADGCR